MPGALKNSKTAGGNRWRRLAGTDRVERGALPFRDYICMGHGGDEKCR
jgi:hypothetical protein